MYDGKAIYVGHISLVKGVPFFGYHVGYRYFLKIYMLNPLHMTRFADLLHQGAILGQPLQPFEAHLQYLLQWMCDFNLYGCAYIDCRTVKFRHPVPDYWEKDNTRHKWHDRSIPPESILNVDRYPRQSHCSIEVDICVQDILNRQDIEARDQHSSFVEHLNPGDPTEKLVHSLAGLWKDETRRRKRRMGLRDDSSSPFPPEVLVSMSAESRNDTPAGWIHEDEFRGMVQSLVDSEREHLGDKSSNFDDFVNPDPLESQVQTVVESVRDLFPDHLPHSQSSQPTAMDTSTNDKWQPFPLYESFSPPFNAVDFPLEPDERILVANSPPEDNAERSVAHDQADEFGDNTHPGDHDFLQDQPKSGQGDPVAPSLNLTALGITPSQQEELLKSYNGEDDSFADGERPRKRRRLSTSRDTVSQNRVSFLEDKQMDDLESASMSSNLTEVDTITPFGSQQLSQTSIKSTEQDTGSTVRFRVAKQPNESAATPSGAQGSYSPSGSPHYKTPLPVLERAESISAGEMSSFPSSQTQSTTQSTLSPSSSQSTDIVTSLCEDFDASPHTFVFEYAPPSFDDVNATIESSGRPAVLYQNPFYGIETDVPERLREYAGRTFKLESTTLPFLPDFDPTGESSASYGERAPIVRDKVMEKRINKRRQQQCQLRNWEISADPPSYSEIEQWLEQEAAEASSQQASVEDDSSPTEMRPMPSQIDGPTQQNKYGYKFPQKQKSTSVQHETQYMSVLSLEVHVNSRGKLAPNPEQDEISCVFWCFKSDEDEIPASATSDGTQLGVLVLSDDRGTAQQMGRDLSFEVFEEETELDLINHMVDIVRSFDPDILTGYEVHNGSWGYLIERSRIKFDYNLCDDFSRMKSQSHGRFGKNADRWGFDHTSTVHVTGRHVINIWRAMRSELNLLQYTMENVAFHQLHKRIPHYSFADLTQWYTSKKPGELSRCLEYFITRVQINLEILDANELIPRTSEQARLLGVDFFSVFSRGSQFKVESVMFRIAKPENFLLVSPSRKQVGQQNALECLPLVMEPQSAFYNSPLLVLDFQSLYPSTMIAYNYCYSTCLGRIVEWRGTNKLGFGDFKRQPGLLSLVKDSINISPNGLMFVKPSMRKSLLAKMLGEILETRVMVKSGMKVDKDDRTLQQLLNNRQLALKLLANVTYGYTSASFSGRMPCSEIADAIVQTGRETLERAMAFIHSVDRWGAEVVYGDTDSLFIHLKGRTREEAFTIGAEIAKEVTAMNPRPIKLKFEKVYHPCVLLAKKRYVGFKYESPSQTEPEFDAKGIETVRRDGTPAEQKIEEKALKLLFRTADLSQVKAYFQRQCKKIMTGRVSIQDFCFAREVKLGSYSNKGPPPAGALISTKRMLADPRAEPQYGERVPYIVVTGAPGARLIDRCVDPRVLLEQDGGEALQLDAEYYISKNLIPPLERIFNLVGANVRGWWDEMPKIQRIRNVGFAASLAAQRNAGKGAVVPKQRTLEAYMQSALCVVCRNKLPQVLRGTALKPLCAACLKKPDKVLWTLRTRANAAEKKTRQIEGVCRSCAGLPFAEEVRCDSMDCGVYYSRVKARGAERQAVDLAAAVESIVVKEVSNKGDPLEW
ncbi:hypothetical protein FH972_024135 [Carpinus fangiana]|uniref:DNA polymerase n=1 Tax=Carpinus fangiana TaxID=176857 RepID=A0A5N6KX55_9ROSI|nr:hypothetical protein FH972_024135 [Carpinus fangiana]